MDNLTLFEIPQEVKCFQYRELVKSLSFDEQEILRWIMLLYNDGCAFDLDPTYSTGRFWSGLPKPKYKYDINPQVGGVKKGDSRALPLKDMSIISIMFDPPFIVKDVINRELTGIIEKRFSGYKTHIELWDFYRESLQEFWRILKPGGILVFKCQDCVDSGKQRWSHYEIMKLANEIGFSCEDLFILGRTNILWSPNMIRQKHARKNHCYFLVFKKDK